MPTPSRRPAAQGKVKVGICENHNYLNPDTGETGDCPKCASGERMKVNVVRLSDFRCPVCGGKLKPVKTGPSPMTYVYIGLALVAVILGIVLIHKMINKDKPAEGPGTEVVKEKGTDSDSIKAPVVTEPETGPETGPQKGPETEPQGSGKTQGGTSGTSVTPPPANKTVLGGAATLINNSGNITIKFKRSYSLDLGDMDGSTLYIQPGDEIYMANVRNGYLFGGQYKSRNGEEQSLQSIKVHL